jgi:putative ABC transport system substrate-binding protein
VEAGGLLSYGPNRYAQYRRAASFVTRILGGASPGELPVERVPAELVVNAQAAEGLGLTIPPDMPSEAIADGTVASTVSSVLLVRSKT